MVIVTRDVAIPYLASVVVALVTSTVRGIPAEVPLGPADGLDYDCVINCDNLFTVPKRELRRRRGTLGPAAIDQLADALRIALDLD